MKIYTKTGDEGQTSLIGGTRVNKNDIRLDAYGAIDELNSFVGLLVSSMPDDENKAFLLNVQHTLFELGSNLALDTTTSAVEKYNISFDEEKSQQLESEIDRINETLSPLRSFVLPGGSQLSSLCHVCRTITRRTERNICTMSEQFLVKKEVISYVNRLSDYFFVLSRFFNKNTNQEIFYMKD